MKIVNNRKMLIGLMTVFGFSVFVKSNCCMAMGRVIQAQRDKVQQARVQQAEQARQAQQAEQARQAQEAEQARQAQEAEQAQRAQTNQNTRDINDMRGRIQTIEYNLQNQINPDINTVENELQELREQIARQGRHITFLEYGAGSLLGGAVAIGAFYYLKGSSRK